MHFVVVVLGDLGRSPRMQYHCMSMLDAGHEVTFVGYTGEELIPELQHSRRLHLVRLTPWDLSSFRAVTPLYFALRILSLFFHLLYALIFQTPNHKSVDFVLVQNPPALPSVAVIYVYAQIKAFYQRRRPGIIIDWHNLGYSMLSSKILQKIAKFYEVRLARCCADGHLTVTRAMRDYLKESMHISKNVGILYDQPPDCFQRLDVDEQHALWTKLDASLRRACPSRWYADLTTTNDQTLFTEAVGDAIRFRPGRPLLLTSSTSWTPDEDFGILLESLQRLDAQIAASNSPFSILMIVTGKGPLRDTYEQRISRLQLSHVAIATLWLEPGDYPQLLACADLGVSLHTSTSGLDLPMKVLDLFGCEIPVVAHQFACLDELVQDGVNGRVFGDTVELSEILWQLLEPYGKIVRHSTENRSFGALAEYTTSLQDRMRWGSNWTENAFPVILRSTPID